MNSGDTMAEKTEAETLSENLVRAFVQFNRLRLEHHPPEHECFRHGLKHSEIMLLMTLADTTPEGAKTGVSVSELSRKMRVKSPSITPILAGLEKRKMVERTIDPSDRRIIRVRLMDAGRSVIHDMWLLIVAKTKGLVEYLGEEKSRRLIELINESFAYIIEQSRQKDRP